MCSLVLYLYILPVSNLIFHLSLDPVTEIGGHRSLVWFAMTMLFNEFVVEGVCDIEFNCIVASCHCLDVPFNEVVLGDLTDIISEHRDIEGDGDCQGRDEETLHLSGGDLFMSEGTGNLHEQLGAATKAFFLFFWGRFSKTPIIVGAILGS